MKQSISTLLFIAFLCSGLGLQAQEKDMWSLERCINHAHENNITIMQQALDAEYRQNQHKQSKMRMAPNLNARLGQNLNFGRSLGFDNTYRDVNSNNLDFSASTSVDLFNGFQIRNTIRQREFELKASLENLHKVKNDISLLIASQYLEILLAQEMVEEAEAQMGITEQQIDRTGKLVDAGSIAKGKLLEIQAQYSMEELQLVEAQNQLQLAYLDLVQLLDLEDAKEFDVVKPDFPEIDASNVLMDARDVYNRAVGDRPEIRGATYNLKGSEMEFEVAKGARYPSLSFGANYYNNYNNKYEDMTGNKIDFSDQIDNNDRKSLGFTLNIPIFNYHQTKTNISNARIQVRNQELELERQKDVLRKEIETAYTNAFAALKKYVANKQAVVSMKEAFRYMEEKYNLGAVNSVEYNESKNNLTKAQLGLLQAKYQYIFSTKILDFYNGVPICL